MLTHFRKRLKHADVAKLQDDDDDEDGGSSNKGQLIVDATCAPADIAYPTDIGLLNEAKSLMNSVPCTKKAPANRGRIEKNARKAFLAVSMKKNLPKRVLQRGICKQLQYTGRNLKHIGDLSEQIPLTVLASRLYRYLLVVSELHRQHLEMYRSGSKSISERLVSISPPHVRPIVQGKAAAKTEFGMKLSNSVLDGMSMPERMSRNAYNEGGDLVRDIER